MRAPSGAVAPLPKTPQPVERANVVHTAGPIHLTPTVVSMEQRWSRLNPAIRGRIVAKIGTIVSYWAAEICDGRITAVALGERGLAWSEPIVKADGGLASIVRCYPSRPGTVRSIRVEEDTTMQRYHAGHTQTGSRLSMMAARLPQEFVDLLGNLPGRAQTLLQEPFLASPNAISCDYYVEELLDPSGQRSLRMWCYLTDRQLVTFAQAQAITFSPTYATARWQVTCWRFDIAKEQPAAGTVTRRGIQGGAPA